MNPLSFPPDRVSELRKRGSGQIGGVLTLPSEQINVGSIRHYYRWIVTHNEEGAPTGVREEIVNDVVGVTRELRPARLTVLALDRVEVHAELATTGYRQLDIKVAIACGFKTAKLLRDDWDTRHPRSELAQLVWFALGDVRDKDRFLNRYVHRGGDYTGDRSAAVDELPALTAEQLAALAVGNQQRFVRAQADTASRYAEETLADRVARLETATGYLRREIKQELRIITERANRGMRKIDGDQAA